MPTLGDRALEAAWLCAVVGAPLVFNPWGSQIFELPKVVLVRSVAIALLAIWLARCLSEKDRSLWRLLPSVRWGNPFLWAGALAVIATAATLAAPDIGESFWGSHERQEGLYTLLAYLLLFVLVAREITDIARARRLLFALSLGSVPVIAYGLTQASGLDPVAWQSDKSALVSTIGRSNFLGSYLALVLPVLCAVFLLARQRWLKVLCGVSAGGAIVLLYQGSSRSALLAIVLASLAGGLAVAWRRGLVPRGRPAIVGGALGLAGAAVAVYVIGGWLFSTGGSAAARLTIWRASLQLIAERPVLGFGPDGFAGAFRHVYPPELAFFMGRDAIADRAHNALVQQAVTTGMLGLFCLLGLWAAIGVTLWQGLASTGGQATASRRSVPPAPERSRPPTKPGGPTKRGMLGGLWPAQVMFGAILIALIAHVLDLTFSFEVAATGPVFWALSAAGVGLARGQAQSVAGSVVPLGRQRSTRRVALALGALALPSIVFTNGALLVADTSAGRAQDPSLSAAARLTEAERAVAIWPWQADYWAAAAELSSAQAGTPLDERPALERSAGLLHEATRRRPSDDRLWAILGEKEAELAVRFDDGDALARASSALERALELAPNEAEYRAAYGVLLVNTGSVDAGIARLRQATELDPTDGQAWHFLGRAYTLVARQGEAGDAFARARKLGWTSDN